MRPAKLPQGVLVAIGVLVGAAACAGLLYFAWEVEESQKPVRTVVVQNPDGDDIFTVDMQEKEGRDYIIYCNEEDFQDAFRLFADFVHVDTEPLKVPGGPMVLALADVDLPEELRPAQRATIEVLKRHSPRRVVLVAHTECLYYDTLAAWQDHLDEVKQREHRDLIAARRAIKTWFPKAEVEIYLADKHGERLKFYPMSEDEVPPAGEIGDRPIDLGSGSAPPPRD